jgi:limonene 1,2-monooxygenase
MPELRGQLAPLRASYEMVAANKRSYGGPAMAAIRRAYDDAGRDGSRPPPMTDVRR